MKVNLLGKLLICMLFLSNVVLIEDSHSVKVSTNSVRSFVNGKTHKISIKKAFGKPDYIAKVKSKESNFVEQWIYKSSTLKKENTKFLFFEFDKKDILLNHGYVDKKVLEKLHVKAMQE